MNSVGAGRGIVGGAFRAGGGIVKWFGENIVGGILAVGIAIVGTLHVLPYAVLMAVYHNDLQTGVDKASAFVRFAYNVLGASWESTEVADQSFNEGQAMTQESLGNLPATP